MAKQRTTEQQQEKQKYWKRHIEECSRKGSSQAEYCRRHKLSTKSFTYWKRRFRQQETDSFIPVQIKPEIHIPANNATALVLCKEEYRIEIKEGFNPEVLGEVLRTLKDVIFPIKPT